MKQESLVFLDSFFGFHGNHGNHLRLLEKWLPWNERLLTWVHITLTYVGLSLNILAQHLIKVCMVIFALFLELIQAAGAQVQFISGCEGHF